MEFETRDVRLPQGTIKYHVGGRGAPLLCFHSAGGVRFSTPLRNLAASHTVYMPIVPGFDGTDLLDGVDTYPDLAKLFAGFADTVIGAQCDVLGHSFGGRLAIWFAALHPDKVRLLVLEAPSGFRPKSAPQPSWEPQALRAAMFAHPERIPPGEKSPEAAAENRKAALRYHKSIDMDEALVEQLDKVRAVTLILHGTKDGMIPEESAIFLKSRIATSHLVYVYDAAHAMEVDQPERFTTLVGDFLARGQGFLVNAGSERRETAPA